MTGFRINSQSFIVHLSSSVEQVRSNRVAQSVTLPMNYQEGSPEDIHYKSDNTDDDILLDISQLVNVIVQAVDKCQEQHHLASSSPAERILDQHVLSFLVSGDHIEVRSAERYMGYEPTEQLQHCHEE